MRKLVFLALALALALASPAYAQELISPQGCAFGSTTGTCVQSSTQMVSAVAFGADGTGVLDSSAAINSAVASTVAGGWYRDVYLPGGYFTVTHQIVGQAGQCLVGDGKWNTQLHVTTGFDPNAASVVAFTCVRDIGIVFDQAQNGSSRAAATTLTQGCTGLTQVCKYPWAIQTPLYTTSSPGHLTGTASPIRANIHHVMISAGWDGIDTTNICGDIDDVQIGTLDVGIQVGNCADFMHVSHIHEWDWGISAVGTTYSNIYSDGTAIGVNGNRADGAVYEDVTLFRQRFLFTALASRATVNGLHLDGTGANLEVTGTGSTATFRVNGLYFGWGAANTGTGVGCPLIMNGPATLQIEDFNGSQDADKQATSLLCQTGGSLSLGNGKLIQNGTTPATVVLVSGIGTQTSIDNINFGYSAGITLPNPVIGDTATGAGSFLQVTDTQFPSTLAGSVAISLATDTAMNLVTSNVYGNLTFAPPGNSGNYTGAYGAPFSNYVLLTNTSSSTWTVPFGISAIRYSECGAGGSGGGVASAGGNTAATGGGAGTFIASDAQVTGGGSVSYQAGAAVTGGGAGNNNGTAGNSTTFHGVVAPGGLAGKGSATGSATVSTSNNLNAQVQPALPIAGDNIIAQTAYGTVAVNGASTGGPGGNSPWGNGGSGGNNGAGSNATAAQYCAGGGGAGTTGTTAFAGGNSTQGAIVVRY